MVFKNLCVLVLWTKLASALEGIIVLIYPTSNFQIEAGSEEESERAAHTVDVLGDAVPVPELPESLAPGRPTLAQLPPGVGREHDGRSAGHGRYQR